MKLSTEEARWLSDLKVATVTPGQTAGTFDVLVGNYAGVLARGDLRVTIEPKVRVGSLMWLVMYARTGMSFQVDSAQLTTTDFLTALTELYLRYLDEAIAPGLLTGYWLQEETSSTLRGRIRIADQINRRFGQLYPLELTYEEFGANILENRVLLTAVHALIRAQSANSADVHERQGIIGRLKQRADIFYGVDELVRWDGRGPARTRLNARYENALPLAELILDGAGLDARNGSIWGTNFLLEVWRVFESAVARAVRTSRPDLGVHTQMVSQFIDGHNEFRLRPDLVISRGGRVIAVMDTKYKFADPQPADLYQMFTYASFYGIDTAHLIYAANTPRKALPELAVSGTGIAIQLHALNLDHPDLTFESDIADLVERVVSTASQMRVEAWVTEQS